MLTANEGQIRALIRLLADEDERIARTISSKLVQIGDPAVPLLLEAELEQPEMARRIEEVLDEIRGGRLEDELQGLVTKSDDAIELEAGAFLI